MVWGEGVVTVRHCYRTVMPMRGVYALCGVGTLWAGVRLRWLIYILEWGDLAVVRLKQEKIR